MGTKNYEKERRTYTSRRPLLWLMMALVYDYEISRFSNRIPNESPIVPSAEPCRFIITVSFKGKQHVPNPISLQPLNKT